MHPTLMVGGRGGETDSTVFCSLQCWGESQPLPLPERGLGLTPGSGDLSSLLGVLVQAGRALNLQGISLD